MTIKNILKLHLENWSNTTNRKRVKHAGTTSCGLMFVELWPLQLPTWLPPISPSPPSTPPPDAHRDTMTRKLWAGFSTFTHQRPPRWDSWGLQGEIYNQKQAGYKHCELLIWGDLWGRRSINPSICLLISQVSSQCSQFILKEFSGVCLCLVRSCSSAEPELFNSRGSILCFIQRH